MSKVKLVLQNASIAKVLIKLDRSAVADFRLLSAAIRQNHVGVNLALIEDPTRADLLLEHLEQLSHIAGATSAQDRKNPHPRIIAAFSHRLTLLGCGSRLLYALAADYAFEPWHAHTWEPIRIWLPSAPPMPSFGVVYAPKDTDRLVEAIGRVAHEIGHLVISDLAIEHELKVLAGRSACGHDSVDPHLTRVLLNWCRELAADRIASKLVGPVYRAAFEGRPAQSAFSPTHPSDPFRLGLLDDDRPAKELAESDDPHIILLLDSLDAVLPDLHRIIDARILDSPITPDLVQDLAGNLLRGVERNRPLPSMAPFLAANVALAMEQLVAVWPRGKRSPVLRQLNVWLLAQFADLDDTRAA